MKRFLIAALLCTLLLACAVPGLAANKLAYAERTITVFEGDTVIPELIREGIYAEDGTFTYSTNRPKVIEVSEDGAVTGLVKGDATLTCTMTTAEGRKQKCTTTIKVARRVQEVSLNTKRLNAYMSDDPYVEDLLQPMEPQVPAEGQEQPAAPAEPFPVIVIPVNKTYELTATALPSDATNRVILFETSDVTVAQITRNNVLKGLAPGECDLIVSSKQNPEVTQVLRLIVVQPIKKLTITADGKNVSVGSTLQLNVAYEPYDATMQEVVWTSDNAKYASVDEFGTVTGLKRGSANIKATAADGSGKYATYHVAIEQGPESVVAATEYEVVNVGASKRLTATVLPSNVNNKNVTWTSSDDSVATVAKNGTVKGVSIGSCTMTCTCDADPGVYTTVEVTVQQPVQKIVFLPSSISLEVNTSAYLMWEVQPATATNPAVTFKSSNERIAVVDESGRVTGIKKGSCKITATATDGSKKSGSVSVKVTQPVEGVYFRQNLYHLPYREYMTVHAYTQPKDADNQAMSWYTNETYIAAVTTPHTNTNYTRLYGNNIGSTTFNVVTDDGGYSAASTVVVDHYNDPVKINDLYANFGDIRINLWNQSNMCLTRINFTIDMYEQDGTPMHCTTDGGNRVTGYYSWPLQPGTVTERNYFHFTNYLPPNGMIGGMILRITGYNTNDLYTIDGVTKEYSLNIPEDKQPELRYPQGFKPAEPVAEVQPEPAPVG